MTNLAGAEQLLSCVSGMKRKHTVVPVGWTHQGTMSVLDRPLIMFLLSRQGRTVTAATWWFCVCAKILETLAKENVAILVTDTVIYQQVFRYLAQRTFPTLLLSLDPRKVTELSDRTWTAENLAIFPQKESLKSRPELFVDRDKTMSSLADIVVGVAVRSNGVMESIGLEAIKRNVPLFAVNPPHQRASLAGNMKLLEQGAPSLQVRFTGEHESEFSGEMTGSDRSPMVAPQRNSLSKYFWHYTRAMPGPWPDQSWPHYVEELVTGEPGSDHEACDTLYHILASGKIFGSGVLIRGGYQVVCLSEITPDQMEKIKRFNPALNRWNFQPFGIGIRKTQAFKYGARQVIYGTADVYRNLRPEERYLFQRKSGFGDRVDWQTEREWRISGDLDLRSFGPDDILVLVKSDRDRNRISAISPFPVQVWSPFAE